MSTLYDTLRKLFLLFALVSLAGLLYSIWGVTTGQMKWFYIIFCFLGVVGTCFTYVIVTAKGIFLRRRETLAQMVCPSCGAVYGMETALQARSDYEERWKDAHSHQQNPKDFQPYWHVRCPKCQKRALFQKDTLTLESNVA